MTSNEPSATVITIPRSTSILLESYGYSEHDPGFVKSRAFSDARLAAAALDPDEWQILLDGFRTK